LCGGTHVGNTNDIGLFKITSESSIASGVRRIEALTGVGAEQWIADRKEADLRRQKAESAKEEEKRVIDKRIKEEVEKIDALIAKARVFGSVKMIAEIVKNMNMEGLRVLSDKIRGKERSAIAILATVADDKASFIVSVTEDLVRKDIRAGDLAKELAGLIDGSGGGKPNFAQGGGKSPAKLESSLEKIVEIIAKKL
ncbi:MAG: DHHA1 domain-containing protein, partial [Candidatus Omnitrophota bacterium]|nr:DHHA1 domain-containing protein [Candidatus Omnitrophota bacterium]